MTHTIATADTTKPVRVVRTLRTARAVRGALLAVGLLVAGSAPAQAVSQHDVRDNWLYVSVTRGEPGSADTRRTLVLCDPPTGHAHAARACVELSRADGDIGSIPPRKILCPMLYSPVTVHARGEWNGRAREYDKTFSNACELGARTGAVFAL
ncbi:SSI family serine proteinase inhibitor [Streptomyces sp. ME02-8801-2C]|uniref:SSI family serine proteinase inhibitor n=1 Tax=Streptomyces sp. ME02-8801-2C TaxID=3028680 RepID=UPI0029B0565B|nr:SSI family serine proteinase inhibitor [Streptomyces sp. ME02-8801-2C]MDX3451078.1 SSI family serine proteinase inhibitor [Streptomyces sp. ME02-8801-2C]